MILPLFHNVVRIFIGRATRLLADLSKRSARSLAARFASSSSDGHPNFCNIDYVEEHFATEIMLQKRRSAVPSYSHNNSDVSATMVMLRSRPLAADDDTGEP